MKHDRNVHAYFSVDYDVVWAALQDIADKVQALDELRSKLLQGVPLSQLIDK